LLGRAGQIEIEVGDSYSGVGGYIYLIAGSSTSSTGGQVFIQSGTGGKTSRSGRLYLMSANVTTLEGNSGNVLIESGAAGKTSGKVMLVSHSLEIFLHFIIFHILSALVLRVVVSLVE
jgi:hypothetical protein